MRVGIGRGFVLRPTPSVRLRRTAPLSRGSYMLWGAPERRAGEDTGPYNTIAPLAQGPMSPSVRPQSLPLGEGGRPKDPSL